MRNEKKTTRNSFCHHSIGSSLGFKVSVCSTCPVFDIFVQDLGHNVNANLEVWLGFKTLYQILLGFFVDHDGTNCMISPYHNISTSPGNITGLLPCATQSLLDNILLSIVHFGTRAIFCVMMVVCVFALLFTCDKRGQLVVVVPPNKANFNQHKYAIHKWKISK